MNISEPFVKRPVMTTLVMTTIFLFGVISYFFLPVSDIPNIDLPTIQVIVSNPGANPDTMATTCAVPLEKEFMIIDGLDTITSSSTSGVSILILQFALEKSIDTASIDVNAAIARALPNLPRNLPFNPTYQKVNPSSAPILYLAITSPTMTLYDLYDYVNTSLGQRISMIDGVSAVVTYGSPFAVRVQVDPEKIAGKNLELGDVAEKIKSGNVNYPTGSLSGKETEYTVNVEGQLYNAKEYNELVLKDQKGALVKISSIGKAIDSLRGNKFFLDYLTKKGRSPAIVFGVQRLPGANTLEVIKNIEKILPDIQKTLPGSLKIEKLFDKSQFINASVNDVKFSLFLAFLLVVAVIYFSLGKIVNTIIPSLALPLSLLGTLIIMYFLHYTIDTLSLLALTLSIGFLVDDAIVVLENNVRHVQLGENSYLGTLKGSKEIGPTVVSMTSCLIIVFIPMLFLGGIVGRFFKEFSVTVIVVVLFSGFVSLTTTPLLCSRFIPPYVEKTKMEKLSDAFLHFLLKGYEKSLSFLLHHRPISLIAGALCIAGSIFLTFHLSKDFLPNDDLSFIIGYTQMRDGTSPDLLAIEQRIVADKLIQDPSVNYIVSVGAFQKDNEGLFRIGLKDYKERGRIEDVIHRLMQKTKAPNIRTYLSTVPLLNLQIGQARALYQYALTSLDQKALNIASSKMETALKNIEGLTSVSSDLDVFQPRISIDILRDKASNLGISAEKLELLFLNAFSSQKVSSIKSSINQYDVILETLPSYSKDASSLSKLYIRSNKNKLVPLSELISIKQDAGPLQVNHINGIPSATLSFNLENISLGDAIDKINKVTSLPSSVTGQVLGTANVFKDSFKNLSFLFPITLFLIYIVLGILYENFIHPLTVMTTLPPATFGALLTLYLFKAPLSIYSFMGIMMLIGIVMKNGIMLVDFAIIARSEKNIEESILSASLTRFRPILMTTLAALMGALPIALGIGGISAEGRKPLGLAVVGGLILSQILTLYLTPVVYTYLEELNSFVKSKKSVP